MSRSIRYFELLKEFREENKLSDYEEIMKLFSEKVQLPIIELKHINVGRKPITSSIARTLESKFGKPSGWMDEK